MMSYSNITNKYSTTLTAPLTVGAGYLLFELGGGLFPRFRPFGNSEFQEWAFSGTIGRPDGLRNHFIKAVNFVTGPDVEITITWPN